MPQSLWDDDLRERWLSRVAYSYSLCIICLKTDAGEYRTDVRLMLVVINVEVINA